MKHGKMIIAIFSMLFVVVSTVPEPSLAAQYHAKIDENLRLEGANSYVVAVRVDWNLDLEPMKFNRGAVLDELKLEAARTQEPVITYLQQKEDAKVLNTFWLVNTILIEANADTILELATFAAVNEILANFDVTIPENEDLDYVVPGTSTATWNIEKVRAPEVWEEFGVTGENIRVAVTDTGIDIGHPDLAGTLWTDDPTDPTYPGGWIEYDSYGNIVPGSVPHDTYGHGTATYGIVVGQATGPYGAVGMAPDAIGMHALTLPYGGGSYAQVIAGLQWVIDPVDQYGNPAGAPAQVSSHSWGAYGYHDQLIEPIRNMWYANHFVVASIGNGGEGTSGTPGNIYETIAVGATDINDYVAWFSSGEVVYKTDWNNPPEDWPDQWIKPDVSAPGDDCIVPYPPDTYRYWDGTSFAAPHVGGAATLMFSVNPTFNVQEIEDALEETAVWYDHYYPERPDIRYGWGRIDAFEATAQLLGARVNVTIHAYPTTDKYVRSHGLSIDEPLPNDWWNYPGYEFLVTGDEFTYSRIVHVEAGYHYVEYAASGYVPDYAWHAEIYINGELKAMGDVGRYHHLTAVFRTYFPPLTPSEPSGPSSGFVYKSITYSASTTDPEGDDVSYEFNWGDGTSTTVGPYPSGENASASHQWTRPITYQIKVRAKDVYGAWSDWSSPFDVTLSQNDANSGGDAGNNFDTATSICAGVTYYGTMYEANPLDPQDWYKFYAADGKHIKVYVWPPSGVDFDLQLFDPNGILRGSSKNGPGEMEYIYCQSDVSGYWRIYVYIYDGEGRYTFRVKVYSDGGGCPILSVYNGQKYLREGLLDIHDLDGTDVITGHTLIYTPKRVRGTYQLQLTEHPQTISHIDQVRLYAILKDKTLVELPLIWAWHSEGNTVKPKLLFSDDWKAELLGADYNNGTSQSIYLGFVALPSNMEALGFLFEIEGNNALPKPPPEEPIEEEQPIEAE